MKKIKVLGERVPPPSATDVPSGANSICGFNRFACCTRLLPGREGINGRGIKWLPICEDPVLIRLLILGSSLVVELSLSIKLSTKGHRSSWRGERGVTAGLGLEMWMLWVQIHSPRRSTGTWSSCLSTAVVPLIKTMFIVEEVPNSVFT